jgi:hypothetical protein
VNRRILVSSYPIRRPAIRQRELVEFPRWIGGKVQMVPMSWDAIPAGWQTIKIRVPMRPASCEETDCPRFLEGWSEVLTADGGVHSREGLISHDEAAATFGLYGPHDVAPTVIHHPPGTPCPEIHKVPSGFPPVYVVDGRVVLWPEFEDAIGGGVHTAQQIRAAGY